MGRRPGAAMKQFGNVLAAAGLALVLVACGRGDGPEVEPRPVLVAHPGGGAAAAVSAYAGEVRAREEAPLSFRAGGHLVRRHVDVGDHVKRGELLAELDHGDVRLQLQAA
jgi:membrane fusion protein, multidrug efflux system